MTQKERRATILLLDGARPDVFNFLASAGDLPHISRYVLEPGGIVPATTVFPSTTGIAYLPLLTGCFPGTCNIPGIRWMDLERYSGRWLRDRRYVRNYCGVQAGLLNTDLRTDVRSLFDIERDSIALCTPFTRGLAPGRGRVKIARIIWGSQAHYTSRYELLDRAVGRELVRMGDLRHRLVLAVFPAVDGVTHWYDPWHSRVLDVYRQFDTALGRYAKSGGFAGDHLVAIVSDHGMTQIELHTDVGDALETFGLPTLRHPILWRRSPKVAVMISGNASAQVYLRPGHRRGFRYSLPEIEAGEVPGIPPGIVTYLAELTGMALVAGTDGDDVVVVSRQGTSRLTCVGDHEIRYSAKTADVLGLGDQPQTLSIQDWLAASYDGPYPDAPAQLHQIFRSSRTGDLVLAAAPGTDLRYKWEIPEHRSGHGSLIADHMRCVVALNRPTTGPLRTVDIFALVLQHLGYEIPSGIDGVRDVSLSEVA